MKWKVGTKVYCKPGMEINCNNNHYMRPFPAIYTVSNQFSQDGYVTADYAVYFDETGNTKSFLTNRLVVLELFE